MAPSSKPGPAASGTQPVVAGIAARMPQSGSTAEFWKNLVDGKNMVTKDDTHWESGFHGQLPLGKGSLTQQEHFDNFFFNMSGAQAEKTDPQLRFLLELSYEALVDSNLDIQKLKGSNCGVFVGSCFSDCHKAWLNDVPAIVGYENTGCAQSMYANRLSFFYDFHGPSFNVDTACSSSLVAFSQACRALESGECDVCLVGGSSITLHAGVSVAFNKLSMLSKDSACMSFSKNGNGYARSEGVAIMVLYREDKVGKYMRDEEASDSQAAMKTVTRPNSYFKVLGFGINSDGFTKKGITFPNGEAQLSLYKEVCDRAQVDPADIFYIEAHGTGTAAGDGQELEALRRAYLEPRNAKTKKPSAGAGGNNFDLPLLLGSVKSNMGHAEGASAMAGLMKLCLSAAHGLIPANLHYTYEERNTGCEGILGDKKKCMVVEEHFPIAGGASGKNVAISSFGFGGTNAHAVMCGQVAEPLVMNKGANYKGSEDHAGEAADKKLAEFMSAAETSEEQWKYITPVFGRTADGVQACLETLGEKGVSFSELVGNPCVHDHQKEFPALGYRTSAGDVITTDEAQPYVTPAPGADESDETKPRPLYLLFSGNGGMWPMMGKELHQSSKVYRETFDRCCDHLEKAHGYTGARQFLTEPDITKYTAVEGVCGLAAVQISLVAMLKEAGLEWEGMFGHSAGETAMGYADGCLTLEETMSVAYFRSLCGADSVDKENPGGMYACGVSREKMEELLKRYNCSELTQVGCDNDPGMVTLSGCEKEMKPICVELTSKKILCRKVPTFGVAFHSAMLEKGLAKLSAQLEEVIDNAPGRTKESRRRSAKWISTCYDDEEIRKDPNHPGNFISAEYHYYNFRNTVEFYRAVKARVPANAVVVEVGPSGLFRSSIKKIAAAEKRPMHYFSLMSREKNCLHTFQNAFGQLFFQGLVPNLKVRTLAQPNALGQLSHIHLTPKDVPAIARDIELKQAFVMWDHGSVYPIPTTADMLQKTGAEGEELRTGMSADDWKNMHAVDFDFTSERDKFIVDHVIDKTVLMPACGYIYCAWEAFAHVLKKRESIAELSEARDVALVDFKIHQGIRLDDSNLQMRLMVKFEQQNPANGENEFKILNGEEKIVTGKIKLVKGAAESMNPVSANLPDTETFGHALGAVNSMEFYNRIARNGYNYETAFQLVENVGIDDSWAWVRFDKAADIVAEKEAKAKAKAAAEAVSAEAGSKGASSPVEGVPGKTVVPLGGAPDANVAETGQLGGAGEKEKGSIYSSEEVVFNRYWISYLDNLLQVSLLKNLNDSETLRVPTVIREVTIRGSAFGSFLKKMREGNMGSMRHIASNDSVVSRVSSVEVEKEVQEEERKSYIVEAQVQSGTQLVKILPYMNQVSSDIADVVGLQTSIMARSTKAKERRVLHVARKKVQDLASTIQVAKPKTAHALLLSYLKEQFVSGNFSVLDFCPQLVDELTQSFVETNNVEKFAVKFLPQAGVDGEKNPGRMEFAISEEKVGEYNTKLDGICEEMKDGDKFDVVLVHSGEVLKSKEDVDSLVKTLAEESKKTEEFQPSFIVVATDLRKGSDSAAALAATGVVNDSALLRIVASNAGAGVEFALYKTVSGDADLPSAAVQEFSGADGLMSGAGQQAAPAKEGQEEAAAAKKATAPVQFIRLSDDCFCREHISKLSAFIGELAADESLKKLYLLSSSAGFPGFLKCLQREPGAYAKIRGVHLVAGNNASIGYSSNVTEALAAALQRIASTDARLVRLDVKTGKLSVELSSYDESEKKFPAPFGRFLTFPQPGNLEAFKWKAHPHFSVLSLGDDDAVKNSLEGRILLPAVTSVQRSYSKSGTDSGLRGSSIEELAEEAKKCTPPLGDTCASVRTEMQTDKYELSLPLGLTTRGSENMKRTGSSGSLLGSLFGAAAAGVSTDTKNDEMKAKKEKSPENTTTAKRDISPKTALSKGAMKAAQRSEEELLAESLQQQYLATLTASTLKDLTLYNNAQKQNPLRYVDVSYAALNFRDVMLAYNKIDKDALVGHSKVGDGFGLEFAGFYRKSDLEASAANMHGDLFSAHHGTDNDNDELRVKVVGLTYNSLASKVTVPANLVWELKPTQSLREFATVPCVYATCYYSLLVRGQFTPTTSVLIHAGAGGVGQAALYICLKRTSNPNLIFTTCSSKKRAYLMEKFGHLGLVEKNIGNTRDCSFENLVMQRTNGRGVDICLNSLSDDKLMASVRCVAPFGRFCEIGKYDLMQNTGLGMHCLLKNVSIMGIDLDQILNQPAEWAIVHRLVQEGLNSGEVEPLDVGGCFPTTQITEAFRFMGAGTHVGKVLLSFENQGSSTTSSAQSDSSDPTPDNASSTTAGVTSRTVSEQGSVANAFHPPARAAEDARQLSGESNSSVPSGRSSSADKVADTPNFTPKDPANDVYVIIGGLGGFGLELTQFLASKGVKNIILSSRGRLRNGLQAKYLTEVAEKYRCNISITNLDFSDRSVTEKFLSANRNVCGFFNLGMVLADGLFKTMQGSQWATPILAKGVITENFDQAAAKLNLHFDHFVLFSSVSAGLGNAGQTNYGFANSELDQIVRLRNAAGKAALSVQWGAIGDVGVLSRASKKTGLVDAILPQEILSCLTELEKLLAANETGVHTVYLTPKRMKEEGGSVDNSVPLVDKVIEIVGAKNPKDSATLEMLGADSLQSMEIQSLIKMRTGEKIPMDKLSKMTVKMLREIEA